MKGNSVLDCPSSDGYACHPAGNMPYLYATDYGINLYGVWKNALDLGGWGRLSWADGCPATMILLAEQPVWNNPYVTHPGGAHGPVTNRHNGGTVLGFCDGHVKWYPADSEVLQPATSTSSPSYQYWRLR
jgi:prepilin-type processing-associated H-X9-DG protein